MAYTRQQAEKLCSDSEFGLFRASLRDSIGSLSKAQLSQKLERARRLRDKQRDLFRRQRLATRERTGTKLGLRKDANQRTEQKAKLFGEVVERFEKQLDRLEAAEERKAVMAAATASLTEKASAKPKAKGKRVVKKKAKAKVGKKKAKKKAKKKTGFMSNLASVAERKERLQNTRSKAIQGHVRSRGKRNQAKRDSK